MERLKFYVNEPSFGWKALRWIFGKLIFISPAIVISGLTTEWWAYVVIYSIFGALWLYDGTNVYLKSANEWMLKKYIVFRESVRVSGLLRETFDNAKLSIVKKKESKDSKGNRVIEEITYYPDTGILMDSYNYYLTCNMIPGQTKEQWESKLNAVAHALQGDLVKSKVKRGKVYLTVKYADMNVNEVLYKLDDEHYLNIGYYSGGILKWNFDKEPHMMIIGMTGTGKSTFLRNLIVQFHPDWTVKLIDGKYVEFMPLKKLGFDVAGKGQYRKYIEDAQAEVERRFNLMLENEVNEYTELEGLEPYFLVIDEFIFVMDAFSTVKPKAKEKGEKEKSERELVEEMLRDIALRGRAAGVFLVLILQRPDSTYAPTIIRDNMGCKVVLGGASETAYEMAFGSENKKIEKLEKGQGYTLIGGGGDILDYSFPDYKLGDFKRDLKRIYKKNVIEGVFGEIKKEKKESVSSPM